MECSSQYRDQLFRETERMYVRKMGKAISIDRNHIALIQGDRSLEFRVRSGYEYMTIAHYIDPRWSLERNAWEIGQKVGTKLKHRKVL